MLTPEQIKENWDVFLGYIDTYIESPRKEQLKDFYNTYADRIIMMPASLKKEAHNAFPGGYVDHVNRVVKGALGLHKLWGFMGAKSDSYTVEELVFSALNHDLGKMGDADNQAYIEQTDQWRREKLGEEYTFNTALSYMSIPDRSLFLLQQHGITYTQNEALAIKLHDGLYDDANKSYLMSWRPETRPRTSLVYVVHQADLMAARIEFENVWLNDLQKVEDKNEPAIKRKSVNKKVVTSEKADGKMKNIINAL